MIYGKLVAEEALRRLGVGVDEVKRGEGAASASYDALQHQCIAMPCMCALRCRACVHCDDLHVCR